MLTDFLSAFLFADPHAMFFIPYAFGAHLLI